MKKVIIIISIVIVLIASVGVAVLFKIRSLETDDVQLIDEKELSINNIKPINKEQNAWFDLKKAEEVMYYPADKEQIIDKILAGKIDDAQLIHEMVQKNQKTYDYINNALQKGKLENPSMEMVRNSEKLDIKSFNPESEIYLRKLNKLLLLAVINDLTYSKFGEGVNKLKQEIEFVNLVQNGREISSALSWLTGKSLESNSVMVTEIMARGLGLKKDNAITLQEAFEDYKNNNRQGLLATARGEYLILDRALNDDSYRKQMLKKMFLVGDGKINKILNIASEDIDSISEKRMNVFFAKNVTLNKIIPIFQNLYNDANCNSLLLEDNGDNMSEQDENEKIIADEQIADFIKQRILDVVKKIKKQHCASYFAYNSMQVLLANSAYKMDHNIYADSIDKLKNEGYLAVEVVNKIEGEQLIYNKETGHFDMPKIFMDIYKDNSSQ